MHERTSIRLQAGGFSLIEFMTSGALTLLLLAGVGTIFIGSRASYGKAEQLGQIQENGRYALDQISRDLRMAGFQGCARRAPLTAVAPNLTGLDPLAAPLKGFEAQAEHGWRPTLLGQLAEVPSEGSDVLVLQILSAPISLRERMRSENEALRIANSASNRLHAGDLVLAANCQARAWLSIKSIDVDVIEYEAVPISPYDEGAGRSLGFSFPLGTELMQLESHAYFLLADPKTGRKALWRQTGTLEPEQLASGIEDMQLSYSVDSNDDGVIDVDTTADQITDWAKVVSVSIKLLVVADALSDAATAEGL
jgi:type IV pilus assembly protein PilW